MCVAWAHTPPRFNQQADQRLGRSWRFPTIKALPFFLSRVLSVQFGCACSLLSDYGIFFLLREKRNWGVEGRTEGRARQLGQGPWNLPRHGVSARTLGFPLCAPGLDFSVKPHIPGGDLQPTQMQLQGQGCPPLQDHGRSETWHRDTADNGCNLSQNRVCSE